jgi:hypothetical protein
VRKQLWRPAADAVQGSTDFLDVSLSRHEQPSHGEISTEALVFSEESNSNGSKQTQSYSKSSRGTRNLEKTRPELMSASSRPINTTLLRESLLRQRWVLIIKGRVFLGVRYSKEEGIVYGGISKAVGMGLRSSERIRAQPNSDASQLECA